MAFVGVVRRSLIMGGQRVFHILRRDFLFRRHAPGQIVGARRKIRIRAVPHFGPGIEMPQHVPGARRIVNMVRIVVASESVPRIQAPFQRKVQVVPPDELLHIRRTHIVFPPGKRIPQIEPVKPQLIRHHGIDIVRHLPGNPVVTADGLQPPDFIDVLKSDAVALVGAVLFQQAAQPLDPFPGAVDVGEHKKDDILLADAAGDFRLPVPRRTIPDQRVRPQHPRIGSDGLRGRHADIRLIHAAGGPDALAFYGVRHRRKPHGIFRQLDFHMGKHGSVDRRQFLRMNRHEFFSGKMAGTGIVVPRNHGGTVIGCLSPDQNRCTSHTSVPQQ